MGFWDVTNLGAILFATNINSFKKLTKSLINAPKAVISDSVEDFNPGELQTSLSKCKLRTAPGPKLKVQ